MQTVVAAETTWEVRRCLAARRHSASFSRHGGSRTTPLHGIASGRVAYGPLDVLSDEAMAPLTVMPARANGLMTMMDAGKKDHKIIAVATGDPEFNSHHDAKQLPQHRLLVLRRFFQDHKQLEKKAVEVEEIASVSAAYPVIEAALHRYSEYRRSR